MSRVKRINLSTKNKRKKVVVPAKLKKYASKNIAETQNNLALNNKVVNVNKGQEINRKPIRIRRGNVTSIFFKNENENVSASLPYQSNAKGENYYKDKDKNKLMLKRKRLSTKEAHKSDKYKAPFFKKHYPYPLGTGTYSKKKRLI